MFEIDPSYWEACLSTSRNPDWGWGHLACSPRVGEAPTLMLLTQLHWG
jgi:hypothetical protein